LADLQMSEQIVIDDELLDGPRWFKRMDRNRDGDLSRREFLGPLETFTQFDQDKDGLISVEEVEDLSDAGDSAVATE
jgi:Ca2+-binding EF-hand superfamily protein